MQHPATPAWNISAPVNATVWTGNTAMAAGGDGHIHLMRPGMSNPVAVQAGEAEAVLCLHAYEGGAWAGTDTGEVGWVSEQGEWTPLATFPGRFIEHLAYDAKTRQLAVATGKTVQLLNMQGEKLRELGPHTSTVGGLAVSPMGARLAVGHYNAVTIWPLDNAKASPRTLEWKGAHNQLTYSPDGKWLISAMQEQAIHLWRLSDGLDLQMRGYPSKITQFSWSHDGQLLATNGGFGVPLWSFKDKLKGPAGTSAQVIGNSQSDDILVTAVATHPKGPFAAIGYNDGLTLLTNINDDKAVLLKEPGKEKDPVTSLTWSPDGLFLVTGTEGGYLGLTDFAKFV